MEKKMQRYSNLKKPITIGATEIKNRIVMSPMGDGLSTNDGSVTDRMIAYYSERARAGVGLIIVGTTCVEPVDDGNKPDQHRIYREEHLKGLRRLSDAMHRYGCKVFVQLFHAGLQGNPAIIGHAPYAVCTIDKAGNTVETPYASGSSIGEIDLADCKAIGVTGEQIRTITENFARAAEICQRAGIDGVEVHAGHGYLLYEFLSAHYNKRKDEYGGNIQNRFRFLGEILSAIRTKCGPKYPIAVRISAAEPGVENGITMDEVLWIAKACESKGASMMDISAGTGKSMYIQSAGSDYPMGLNVPRAAAVRKAVNIPVGVVGRIRDLDLADEIVGSGKADLAFIGRSFLSDPYIVDKAFHNRENEIRWCLSCGTCHNTNKLGGIKCSMNPALQREAWYQNLEINGNGRKIAVIGGGPAGCEAARILAMRGFDVTLWEKDSKLGGQVRLAAVPPGKEDMNCLARYYGSVLASLNVDVRTGTAATIETIEMIDPYAVVLASGSRPIIPKLKGAVLAKKNCDDPAAIAQPEAYTSNSDKCAAQPAISGSQPGASAAREHSCVQTVTAEALLAGECDVPQHSRIVIAGIGDTGMETARWLMQFENEVILIDMLEDPRSRLTRKGQERYDNLLKEGVPLRGGAALAGVSEGAVVCRRADRTELSIPADMLVLSLGVKPDRTLLPELQKRFDKVMCVGNAREAGPIYESIADAFNTCWEFDRKIDYI